MSLDIKKKGKMCETKKETKGKDTKESMESIRLRTSKTENFNLCLYIIYKSLKTASTKSPLHAFTTCRATKIYITLCLCLYLDSYQ